jgi:hypothetical protein
MADTDANVPYVTAYGNITKVLERIRTAQTPPRFSTDFLGTTLNLSGGSARPLIPFLKRTGFLGSDGTPTDLYKQFRNPSQSGQAAAKALRIGYANLYRVNEYLHDATDPQLKGIVVQVTGSEPSSSTVQAIVGSFKALKAFANFSQAPSGDSSAPEQSLQTLRWRMPRVRTRLFHTSAWGTQSTSTYLQLRTSRSSTPSSRVSGSICSNGNVGRRRHQAFRDDQPTHRA